MPRNRHSHHQNAERPTPARPDCNFALAPHNGINETWAVFHVRLRPATSDHLDVIAIMDRETHRVLGGELLNPNDTAGIDDLLSCVAHHEGRPLRLLVGDDATLDRSVAVAASELGWRLTRYTQEDADLRWALAALTDCMADSSTSLAEPGCTDPQCCLASGHVLDFISYCFGYWNDVSFEARGRRSPNSLWAARTRVVSA